MMEVTLQKTIARLRRTMPRNADVMAVCDALEFAPPPAIVKDIDISGVDLKPGPIVEMPRECPECKRRREQTRARVRKSRRKT